MILCAGEALIDMIPNSDGAFEPVTGGAVFNTAIGLGRQNVDVALVSGVSSDLFGELLTRDMIASEVSTDHLIRSDRPTTLAFVKLVDGKASYAFYDENTAGRMLSASDMPTSLPGDVQALFFGGISLAVEPCADAYAAFLALAEPDHLIMLDPNVRPGFISDEARYRKRLANCIAQVDILKLSDEDLDWLDPSQDTLEAKSRRLLESGPTLVCITMGSQGAIAFRAEQPPIQVDAPATTVVDTIGAGDAFNAGLLCALQRSDLLSKKAIHQADLGQIQSALTFAAALASETTKSKGSNPPRNFVG